MNGATALHQLGFVPGWEPGDVGSSQPRGVAATKRGAATGTAQSLIAAPVDQNAAMAIHASSLLKPPPPALEEVDARSVGAAWDSVIGALSGSIRTAAGVIKDDRQGTQLALKDLGEATDSLHRFYQRSLNPEAVLLELQLESTVFTAEMTKANLDNAVALRKEQVAAIKEKQRKEQEAAEKQKELENKAGKGQIAALVLGWATSVAQVVTGALKIATGQPQGALDITAGLLGIAKCTLQTIVAVHPGMAGELGKHVDNLAKAELAFSLAAAATSLFTVGRMAKAANAILGKAAGELLTTGVEEGGKRLSSVGVTLVNAMEKGGDAAEAASQLVKNLAQTLVDDVAQQMRNALRIFGGNQKVVDVLAKAFSNEALQTMVEQALWQAAKQARGLSTAALQSSFIEQVQVQLTRAVLRAALNVVGVLDAPLTAMKVIAPTVQQITANALRIEGADEREKIQAMMIRAMMLQYLVDMIGRQLKENKSALERVTQDHIDNTGKVTNAIAEIRDVALDAVSAGV